MADPEVPETDPAEAATEDGGASGTDSADAASADPSAATDGTTAGEDAAAAGTDPADATSEAEPEQDKLTFDHQCFLIDYVDILAGLNEQCHYKNFHALAASAENTVHDVLSGVLKRDGMAPFTRIKPWQKAVLQPQVRLWRVTPAADGGESTRREFKFKGFTDESRLSDLTTDAGGRAGGAGIKEFKWEFAGTNPAEGEKVIGVKMTMHFQSMKDLVGDFDSIAAAGDNYVPGTNPSLLELILHPEGGNRGKTGAEEYDPRYYRVLANVGWAIDEGVRTHLEDAKLIKILKNMNLEMYLNLIQHEVKIKEDGSCDVTVEYVGAMEAALESKAADILFPGGGSGDATVSAGFAGIGVDSRNIEDVEAELEALEGHIENVEDAQACASEQNASEGDIEDLDEEAEDAGEEAEELRSIIAELKDTNRAAAYASFTDALSGKIRHLDLDNGFLEEWQENKEGKRPTLSSDNQWGGVATITIGDQGWFSNPEAEAEDADPSDVDDDDIYFCFLGDIVEQACLSFNPDSKASELESMAIILGPAQFTDPRTKKLVRIALCDIPISYTLFLKFWNEKVIEPEKDNYPVRRFLMDVMQCLIKPALQPKCFPNAPNQTGDVSQAVFTVKAATDVCTPHGTRPTPEAIMAKIGEDVNPQDPGFTYALYYMQTGDPGGLVGDQAADEKRGINHYFIGQDSGLIKSISFDKSDIQGLKEARQTEEGALSNLRELYNAKLKMVGNNIHFPGQYVYVNPPYGVGNPSTRNSIAFRLGLGGYFQVIKVNSAIKRGGAYDTTLECTWVSSGAGAAPTEEPDCSEVDVGQVVEDSQDSFWGDVGDALEGALGLDEELPDMAAGDMDAEDPCQGDDNGANDPWWKIW